MSDSGEDARCPTCASDGPDVMSYLPDEDAYEATCGDEWHDDGVARPNGGEKPKQCEYRECGECWNCGCCDDPTCCDDSQRCAPLGGSR